jgi:hypothetical protein
MDIDLASDADVALMHGYNEYDIFNDADIGQWVPLNSDSEIEVIDKPEDQDLEIEVVDEPEEHDSEIEVVNKPDERLASMENTDQEIEKDDEKKQGKLTTFWKKATQEEKEEANHRGFQELRETFEERQAEEAWKTRTRKAQIRTNNRAAQERCRAKARAEKIAGGWIPAGNKRVSH